MRDVLRGNLTLASLGNSTEFKLLLEEGLAVDDAAAGGGEVNASENTGIAGEPGDPAELMVGVVQVKPGLAFVIGTEDSGE